jgi:hypothetical protein
MKIIKKTTKENIYVVSYIVNSYPIAPDKPDKKQVNLYLTVVMEVQSYKIASVK